VDKKGGLQMATLLEQRYRVDAPLARGGMSAVYRGMDTRLDRPVAIKVMDQRFAEDRQFVDRFEREARAAASLHHPNVIAVHDQGFDGDHVFIVMELVDGGTLRDLLTERGRLPVPLALSVLEPVLSALSAAHRAGLVHRDVKPENVLIGKGGMVKVGDFGLVKAMANASTTSNSVILGTVAYLSPEQVTTGATTSRGDVYSAGVLLYEMLTGTPPYVGDTPLSVAYRHVNDDVPPPSMLAPGIPHALDELVLRATRRDPNARPMDAAAFLAELERVRVAIGSPVVTIPSPSHGEQTMPAAHEYPTVETRSSQSTVPGPQGTRAMLRSDMDTATTAGPPSRPTPTQTGRQPVQPRPGRPPVGAWFRRIPRWAIIAVLFAVVAGVGTFLLTNEEPVQIPQVAGTNFQDATKKLSEAGFQPTIRRVRDDNVAKDTAIGTDPTNGTLDKGAPIVLLVSSGPPVVPDVEPGTPLDTVQKQLQEQGLKPTLDTNQDEFDNTIAKGQVLRLSPSPGTQLKTGDAVTVVLSKGEAPLKPLPNVVGRTEQEARAALREAGYSIATVNTTFDRNVDGGRVIATNPPAGTTPTGNSPNDKNVTLTVSNAVTVPSLQGKRVNEAKEILDRLGLRLEIAFGDDRGNRRIFAQGPEAGQRAQKGSAVRVGTSFF
jgi:serine/threonine-protein kinase